MAFVFVSNKNGNWKNVSSNTETLKHTIVSVKTGTSCSEAN